MKSDAGDNILDKYMWATNNIFRINPKYKTHYSKFMGSKNNTHYNTCTNIYFLSNHSLATCMVSQVPYNCK